MKITHLTLNNRQVAILECDVSRLRCPDLFMVLKYGGEFAFHRHISPFTIQVDGYENAQSISVHKEGEMVSMSQFVMGDAIAPMLWRNQYDMWIKLRENYHIADIRRDLPFPDRPKRTPWIASLHNSAFYEDFDDAERLNIMQLYSLVTQYLYFIHHGDSKTLKTHLMELRIGIMRI